MPVYGFECPECRTKKEIWMEMNAEHKLRCEVCKVEMGQIFYPPAIHKENWSPSASGDDSYVDQGLETDKGDAPIFTNSHQKKDFLKKHNLRVKDSDSNYADKVKIEDAKHRDRSNKCPKELTSFGGQKPRV